MSWCSDNESARVCWVECKKDGMSCVCYCANCYHLLTAWMQWILPENREDEKFPWGVFEQFQLKDTFERDCNLMWLSSISRMIWSSSWNICVSANRILDQTCRTQKSVLFALLLILVPSICEIGTKNLPCLRWIFFSSSSTNIHTLITRKALRKRLK